MVMIKFSKRYLFLSFLSFMFFLTMCEFEPNDSVFDKVEVPISPKASINLPFNSDTVYITGIANVDFSFECAGYQIYKTSFTLDSTEIYSKSGKTIINDPIYFSYNFIKSGIYKMEMVANVESKSGSIADKLGMESFSFKKSWVLIYQTMPSKPLIKSIDIVDGRLKLVWSKSKSQSFNKYTVNRIYESRNDYILPKSITNADSSFYIDSTYIAGRAIYDISVQEGTFTSTERVVYQGERPSFSIQSNNKLECIFSWNKTKFYNSFSSVKVTYTLNSNIEYPLFEISDINDTSFIIKDGIYGDREYYFYLIPKSPHYGYYKIGKSYSGAGDQFYPNTKLCFASVPPYNIYGVTSNYFFRYNTSTGDYNQLALNTIGFLGSSLNDQYTLCNYYRINPNTFSEKYIDVAYGLHTYTGGKITISNNGIVVGHYNNNGSYIEYADLNKLTTNNIKVPFSITNSSISPNGQYIVITGGNPSYFEIWKFNLSLGKYSFYDKQEGDYLGSNITFQQTDSLSKFYISNGNNIELWSCENKSLLKSNKTLASDVFQIDPITKNLICFNFGRLYIYEPDEFKLLWELGLEKYYFDPPQIVVVNSIIYSRNKKIDLRKYEKAN